MILSTNVLNELSDIERGYNSLLCQSWWRDLHSPDYDTMIRGYTCLHTAALVCKDAERSDWGLLEMIANDVMVNWVREAA